MDRIDASTGALNIAMLAAGAGRMYCGSCLRDNALAAGLIRTGQRVTLVPLYTPLRTDQPCVGVAQVFYGGLNVYLQHASRLFRYAPQFIDRLLDRSGLLRVAGRLAGATDPTKLGALTVSVLRGPSGPLGKELDRLMGFLAESVRPDVVMLPNLMFLGIAGELKRRLGVPVVCELSGEAAFLDRLSPPHRQRALELVREHASQADRFIAPSRYYAAHAAGMGIAPERTEVVYPGVSADIPVAPPRRPDRPPTVGYLARVCRDKGYHRLLAAMERLRAKAGFERACLRSAGWLAKSDAAWFDAVVSRHVRGGRLAGGLRHLGEVDRAGKIALLHSVDLLCVPTEYPEAKGLFVLEALAAGVPVVQPAHGSFPELIAATGGGILVPPGDTDALATGLAGLLADHDRRAALGAAGREAVLRGFTDDAMARSTLAVLRCSVRGDKAASAC